jgi:hypothetical protein
METKKRLVNTCLKGNDVAEGFPGELGLGNDKTCQKGSKGQRQSEAVRQESDGKADHQDSERKEFAASCPRDLVEDCRNEPLGRHKGEPDKADSFQNQSQKRSLCFFPHPRQVGSHNHHGDHDNVLKNENGQADLTVGAVDLSPFLKNSEDNGRAAQGEEKPHEHRLVRRKAQGSKNEKGRHDGKRHLEGSSQQDVSFDSQQASERKFEADGEKQKDHADFREEFDLFPAADQPQPLRSDQNTRNQEAHRRRHTELVADQKNGNSQSKYQKEVFEQG